MSAFRPWVEAARPRTLPLAVTCVLLGGALAKASGLHAEEHVRFVVVMLGAGVTVVLLQILANFANDAGIEYAACEDFSAPDGSLAFVTASDDPLECTRCASIA